MKKYDYIIVGSGLFGSTVAYRAHQAGKKVLVIDKRPQLGGNVYCKNIEGINVHKYGAHIFHTSNKKVWDFVNSIVEFNRYTNSPVANYKGHYYNLPFNMNTFNELWGVHTPEEANKKIEEQKAEAVAKMKADGAKEPRNLEEQALTLIGKDVYEKLIKGYTEKQWGRKCTELPPFIIKRLPVRLVFDNNYFNDKYQGIPEGGYNKLIEGLLGISSSFSRNEGSHPDDMNIDILTGIDLPINRPKYNVDFNNSEYEKKDDSTNQEPLEDDAKRICRKSSEAKTAFWNIVKNGQLGVSFCCHQIIGNYMADFVCFGKKLIVEIDDEGYNNSQKEIEDNKRHEELKNYGFTILRLKDKQVLENTDEMISKLKLAMWLSEKTPLREGFRKIATRMVYTGQLDEFFDYKYGKLNFRTVYFDTEVKDTPNYQGNAVINYTEAGVPYTRIIEHKHFEKFGQEVYDNPKTVISREYSAEWKDGLEPYYPVNDERNNELAEKYRGEIQALNASLQGKSGEAGETVIFGGRLAEYKYYDMAPVIENAFKVKIK